MVHSIDPCSVGARWPWGVWGGAGGSCQLGKPSPNSVLGVKFAEFFLPSLLLMGSAQTQAPPCPSRRLDVSIDLPSTSN